MGMPSSHKKFALVTGAGGLLGTHLVNILLKKGCAVRAMYHSQIPELSHKNLEKVRVDILDVIMLEETMQNVDHLYHCAGLVSFEKKDRDKVYKINVEGTANVVNTALDVGVEKLVHVSSVAALPKNVDDGKVTEDMGWVAQKDKSVFIVFSEVFFPFTISTSFITWAGLKKCNPATRSGPGRFSCKRLIESDEVLLARIVSFLFTAAMALRTETFASSFSIMASIITSPTQSA